LDESIAIDAQVDPPQLAVKSRLFAKFERLKTLRHEHLCGYVDLLAGPHGRIFVVAEHPPLPLRAAFAAWCAPPSPGPARGVPRRAVGRLRRAVFGLARALRFLEEADVAARSLSPQTVVVCSGGQGAAKLADWGVYFLSDRQAPSAVPFFIG
jgi:hypothetical protein